jgi:hypothetical protein
MTTSSDGYLTATADPATASVLLSVNFAAATGYNFVTIKRADGTIVRGADGALVPGGSTTKLIDHEAPRGPAVVYTASVSNGLGTITSTTATATLTATPYTARLKSLRTPALSCIISVHHYPDWDRPIDGATLPILGARYPTASQGTRQGRHGTMTVNTRSPAAKAALDALLDSDGPYLLQPSPESGEPDVYVTVGQVTEARPYDVSGQPRRIYSMPLTVVARPSTPGSTVAYPGHTYADSTVAWPLYSGRTGTYGAR